jgi:hypothetical protein
MKIRKILPKGKMMDEQKIREEAWKEGQDAVYYQENLWGNIYPRPANPYTPVVEYTPSLVEMNTVLLSKFTQLEIWRGEKGREDRLAEYVRVTVVGVLERMKSSNGDWTRDEIINDCVNAIKRLTG